MNTLIEKLELQARENPKETILFDETVTKGITYEDLHELSGKVYAWLKYQGIGREDFILINLARGVLPVVAIIGILKAGAAFALVEENCAPERIEYIRKDCGCKSEINRNAWEEILKCEPLDGHEQTDSVGALFSSLENRGHVQAAKAVSGPEILYDSLCQSNRPFSDHPDPCVVLVYLADWVCSAFFCGHSTL